MKKGLPSGNRVCYTIYTKSFGRCENDALPDRIIAERTGICLPGKGHNAMRIGFTEILVILAVALVVLAAVFLGIRQYNKNTVSATSTTEDTQETVLDVNSDDITSFCYVYEGETYAFEKEDETWYYADDHSLNLNQDRIKTMILKVAPLKADQVIENVTDMSQYGLADPERTIQYETADRSVIINIGNLNSMTSQYYIAFPSEMKVYVVTTNVVTGFNYTLEDLVEEEDSTDVAEESQEMQ